MTLPVQRALSLELSKLLPLGTLASGDAHAVLSLARSLQNSGSDIVIEEDLVGLLGRARVADHFATSFKTAVNSTVARKLCDGITLQTGAGPTVSRGLRHTAYFAMAVQCSLLCWSHDKDSVAALLRNVFERQSEALPAEAYRAAPTQEGIFGVLQACEDQTATYTWNKLLDAVDAMLNGWTERDRPIPSVVVRGAIYMFPLLQSLPEDRLVVICCSGGIPVLVVWAHHVLGLTVDVRVKNGGAWTETLFGIGSAQVIIEDRSVDTDTMQMIEPSIVMLEASSKDELFTLKPDPDEEVLQAVFRRPARGLANRMHRETGPDLKPAIFERTRLMSAGYALHLSEHLEAEGRPYHCDQAALLNAVRLLLDDQSLTFRRLKEYQGLFSPSNSLLSMDCPDWLVRLLHAGSDPSSKAEQAEVSWTGLRLDVHTLSLVFLAFAHIQNLDECSDVPLTFDLECLEGACSLDEKARQLDRQGHLSITALDFPEIIYRLARGSVAPKLGDRFPALHSSHGWSFYTAAFDCPDPYHVRRNSLFVKRGVPCHNGLYRHALVDAPSQNPSQSSEWQLEAKSNDVATINCALPTSFSTPLIGDRRGQFVLTLRINVEHAGTTLVRRTGYGELQEALSAASKTTPCEHKASKPNGTALLPPGVQTVSGFGDDDDEEMAADRVMVLLTMHNTAARWRALIAGYSAGTAHMLLRGNNCCVECGMAQAMAVKRPCFLIL